MAKKIIILLGIFILVLIGSGVFYWLTSGADVRKLNKDLPQGVKIIKNVFGKEYKIENKLDRYEVKLPNAWKELRWIQYEPQHELDGVVLSKLTVMEHSDKEKLVITMIPNQENTNIKPWLEQILTNQGWKEGWKDRVKLIDDKFENRDIVKTWDLHENEEKLISYFFKQGTTIYFIQDRSEESIREVISRGAW